MTTRIDNLDLSDLSDDDVQLKANAKACREQAAAEREDGDPHAAAQFEWLAEANEKALLEALGLA